MISRLFTMNPLFDGTNVSSLTLHQLIASVNHHPDHMVEQKVAYLP
jgi:hypothetical protein